MPVAVEAGSAIIAVSEAPVFAEICEAPPAAKPVAAVGTAVVAYSIAPAKLLPNVTLPETAPRVRVRERDSGRTLARDDVGRARVVGGDAGAGDEPAVTVGGRCRGEHHRVGILCATGRSDSKRRQPRVEHDLSRHSAAVSGRECEGARTCPKS